MRRRAPPSPTQRRDLTVPPGGSKGTKRRPDQEIAPAKSRQLQSAVLIGIALLIAVVFVSLAQTADHPVTAAGIGLQTLAGLFAAVQLWANNASNAVLRWTAHQIVSNRWHLSGLLDGRIRSLLIATVWALGGFFSLRLPAALDPPAAITWPLAIAVVALALTGAIAFFLALFMCIGAYFLDGEPLPEDEASTGLQARLAGTDWIWPFVALAFLLGGILQIAAA
jgi:hypothetical protein